MSSRTKYNPGIVGLDGKSWSQMKAVQNIEHNNIKIKSLPENSTTVTSNEVIQKSFGVQTAEWMKLIARINNPQQQIRIQKTRSKLEIILSYIFCISLLLLYSIGILLFFQYL